MTDPSPNPSRARRGFAVLVGLFATWQLVYIVAANLAIFVPLRPSGPPLEPTVHSYQARGTFTTSEPLQRAAEGAGNLIEFWSEVSGQEQGWSMFTPGTPPYSVFAAVEFQWGDGTSDTLLSHYEPRDYTNPPLRPPLVNNRHYHFEFQFVSLVWYASPDMVAKHPELWSYLPDIVRASRRVIRAWLDSRWKEYLANNPHRGLPRAIVLKHRYITTPGPSEPPGSPRTVTERPFARWWPDSNAIDAFDVTKKEFVPVGVAP